MNIRHLQRRKLYQSHSVNLMSTLDVQEKEAWSTFSQFINRTNFTL